MQKAKKEQAGIILLWCAVIGLALCSLGYFVLKTVADGLWRVDIDTYWHNTAYAIRGYDLNRTAHGAIVVDSVGPMRSAIIMPWGRLVANLIYPGFLPLNVATVYYYILTAVCSIAVVKLIYDWMREEALWESRRSGLLIAIALVIMPMYWDDALDTGNMGGVLCLFTVMAVFLMKRHPYAASFLLALACIKPQNIVLFLLVLLLKKQWKILFTTGGMVLGGWGASLLYVKIAGFLRESVLVAHAQEANAAAGSVTAQIINGYAGNGSGSDNDFFMYGIFSKMLDYGWNSYMVLVASGLLGIFFTWLMLFWLRKTAVADSMIVGFAVAALGSVFWCYKTPCDEIIMILCNLLILLYWKVSEHGVGNAVWCGIYLAAMNAKIFRFWGRKLMPGLELRTAITCDMILRIIIFAGMIWILRKKYLMTAKQRERRADA